MEAAVLTMFFQLGELETELAADRESLRTVETLNTDLMKEKALFEKTLETLRENSERQVQMWRCSSRNLALSKVFEEHTA